MNVQNDKKIVTVAVITYHSATTVLETLDSIISQTYGPEYIELIISDDGSKDSTVQIIEQWLALHQAEFHRVQFFANKINGGISKNCNTAWKSATSEWIKTIAGDDVLLPDCLEKLICFSKNISSGVIISKQISFRTTNDLNSGDVKPMLSDNFFELPSTEQYLSLLSHHPFLPSPTSLINRRALESVAFCNEKYKLIEDYPLFLKMSEAGYKISFLNEITVGYRLGESTTQSSTRYINKASHIERERMRQDIVYPNLKKINYLKYIFFKYEHHVIWFISYLSGNRKNLLNKLLSLLLRPYRLVKK